MGTWQRFICLLDGGGSGEGRGQYNGFCWLLLFCWMDVLNARGVLLGCFVCLIPSCLMLPVQVVNVCQGWLMLSALEWTTTMVDYQANEKTSRQLMGLLLLTNSV